MRRAPGRPARCRGECDLACRPRLGGTTNSAASSAVMAHRKSILAATLAVFGLAAAAHMARSGNPEAVPLHVQAPALQPKLPVSAMAWADPPAHPSALSALSNAVVTTAQAAEVVRPQNMDANEPRTTQALRTTILARKAAIARLRARRAQASAERLQKAEALWRHKLAQHRMRVFQASLTRRARSAPAANEQAPPRPAPKAAVRSDPIHVFLHGLGLDG